MHPCQTKTPGWLIRISWLAWIGAAMAQDPRTGPATDVPATEGREVAPGVRLLGRLAHPRLNESSGVVLSRRFPGVLWTHNDGGGGRRQTLYGVSRDGHTLAEFLIVDVLMVDWEDIAIDDEKHLYVGDVGNNDRKRREIAVHQIDEPDPKLPFTFLQPRRSWRLRYPGEPFDCESLFVWKGWGYAVSKVFKDTHAQIYRFPLVETNTPLVLELVATTRINAPVRGADLSPDGRLLAFVTKTGAFVCRVNGDMTRVGKGRHYHFTQFLNEHIEACAFAPDGLIATSESREIFLFTDPAFRWRDEKPQKEKD